MRWLQAVAIGHVRDLFGRQRANDVTERVAEQGIAQSVDAFETPEQEQEPLDVAGSQLPVDAIERMRDAMREVFDC